METDRVERGTWASRIFAVAAVVMLAALVALPWWGDAGEMRLIAEMAYYLALAQLWNLLAGYAGLVSVGQQAYVGLGGYAFFYLTRVLNIDVYIALLLAGPFARCGSPSSRVLASAEPKACFTKPVRMLDELLI